MESGQKSNQDIFEYFNYQEYHRKKKKIKLTKAIGAEEIKQITKNYQQMTYLLMNFIEQFRSQIMPLLLNAYNYELDTGKLARTWKFSIITLI